MPQLLTKYPDVTIQVLESAGARCGPDQQKKILTDCPGESFCAMPGGEVCVYGLDQAGSMTQIRKADIGQLCRADASSGGCGLAAASEPLATGVMAFALGAALLIARRRAAIRHPCCVLDRRTALRSWR